MRCFPERNTLHYRQWEGPPTQSHHARYHDSSSNYVRAQQKPKTFQGLWSSGLTCQRLTYQRVSSWWVDTLNFSCHLLLFWHGHQQRQPPSKDLTGKHKSRRKWGACLLDYENRIHYVVMLNISFPFTVRAESPLLSLFSGSWPASNSRPIFLYGVGKIPKT